MNAVCEDLLRVCTSDDDLWRWVDDHVGASIPRQPVCPEHQAPFDYLKAAYREPARDMVVWAPRGGGKTFLAAVATLLDLLHKPGCQVRILGGSMDQSRRMWEHLRPMLLDIAPDQLDGKPTAREVRLLNGSAAAILPQSEHAVRGLRIHKLRCDEVEMFDPAVWEAAQFVTRSGGRGRRQRLNPACTCGAAMNPACTCGAMRGAPPIRGAVEALSTLHLPHGLMQQVVESAHESGRTILRWCLLDVLESCPPQRDCARCPLAEECNGIAKTRCAGFIPIDDAISIKQRVSHEAWQTEMLCRRPSKTLCVFPSFDPAIHVRETVESPAVSRLTAAIDFGYRHFACLWVRRHEDGTTHVIDERITQDVPMNQQVEYLKRKPWGDFNTITADPAGLAANTQTAVSDISLLRAQGFTVLCRTARIREGLELIRAALRPASGPPPLFIHPRGSTLPKALRCYHYPNAHDETPVKDNIHDHPMDALRYHFVNHAISGIVRVRSY